MNTSRSLLGTSVNAAKAGAQKVKSAVNTYKNLGIKVGIHNAHHPFRAFGKEFGRRSHLQLNWYIKGVRKSGGVKRIMLPFKKIPIKNHNIFRVYGS